MKRFLKIVSLLLSALLLFAACSRDGLNEPSTDSAVTEPSGENGQTNQGEKALPFNKADGVNPFFAKSNENRLLFSLLYEPLFEPDSSFKPVNVIAEDYAVSGTVLTVKIKSGVACRGSTNITAADVVYSFNLAKNSYLYSGELLSVQSAEAVSAVSVNFILEQPDSLAAAKLNFPIVKEGTADIQTDIPTGSGSYYYLEDKLISTADSGKIIVLAGIDTRDASRDAFKIGASDLFFSDLSDCNYTGAAGKTDKIHLNNMVYIGFNSQNGALNKYTRSAVAAALNSEDIAVSAFEGHAVPAKLPFNPAVYYADGIKSSLLSGDKALAESIIDKNGYIRTVNGVRTNGSYSLSFRMIVNSDNRYRLTAAYEAADALNQIGFNITVEPLPFEDYRQRIESGNFDMYIGEIKLDGSMDISEFWRDGSPFSSGIDKTERAAAEYSRYRSGEMTAAEYYGIFAEFYPFVPICFRTGYIAYSADVTPDLSRAPYNIYYNLG